MKKVIAVIAVLAASLVLAQSPRKTQAVVANYDLDSTSDISCAYGAERPVTQKIATSGSSTTVAAVTASTGPFTGVSVGDVIYALSTSGIREGRLVTARASADSITVDSAVNLGTGVTFTTRQRSCGTAATDGWFYVNAGTVANITLQIDQLSLGSGALAAKIECKYGDLEGIGASVNVWPGESSAAAQCNGGSFSGGYCTFTTAGSGSRISFSTAGVTFPEQCRVVMKLTGTDDGSDTGADAEKVSVFLTQAVR